MTISASNGESSLSPRTSTNCAGALVSVGIVNACEPCGSSNLMTASASAALMVPSLFTSNGANGFCQGSLVGVIVN